MALFRSLRHGKIHSHQSLEGAGTPLLNGDLNLIGEENGQFFVYGIPWCGTSGICTTEKQRLGGIVLLDAMRKTTALRS